MRRGKKLAIGCGVMMALVAAAVVMLFKPTQHDCTVTVTREYTIPIPYARLRNVFMRRDALPTFVRYRGMELVEQHWNTWGVGGERFWSNPEIQGHGEMVVQWDDPQLGPQTMGLNHHVRIALRSLHYGSVLATPSKNIAGYEQTASVTMDEDANVHVKSDIMLRVQGKFPTVFPSLVQRRVQRAAEQVLDRERNALVRLAGSQQDADDNGQSAGASNSQANRAEAAATKSSGWVCAAESTAVK